MYMSYVLDYKKQQLGRKELRNFLIHLADLKIFSRARLCYFLYFLNLITINIQLLFLRLFMLPFLLIL